MNTAAGRWPGALVVSVAVLATLCWLHAQWWQHLTWSLIPLALMWMIATVTQVQIGRFRLSMEDMVPCAVLFVVGPSAVVFLSPVTAIPHLRRKIGISRKTHNVSTMVLGVSACSWVFDRLHGPIGHLTTDNAPRALVVGLAAMAALLAVNAALMSIGIRVIGGQAPATFLRQGVLPVAVPNLVIALTGLPIAAVWLGGLTWFTLPLIIVPLLASGWAMQQVGAERAAQRATMKAFIEVVEAKDVYTRGHSERVQRGAGMVGRALELPAEQLAILENAGLLHDCGKVGIPLSILRKPGRLTDDEMDVIRLHPARGVELMGNVPFLEQSKVAVLHHHEKWNGTGYPAGLAAEDIPYFSRIIGIVDAFDCLTSTRSYRAAKTVDEALAILEQDKLTHFDPSLVDVFSAAVRKHGWHGAESEPAPERAPEEPMIVDHDDLGLSLAPGSTGEAEQK